MKKTKVSKRILSILLAALMVITSIPIVAFNVFAADLVQDLETAMNNYVTAMENVSKDTTRVYTKMKPAYDAYVAAQKQYDSLKYGGVDNGAQAAITALNNAITAMNNSAVSFDAYKGTAVPTFGSGNSTYSVGSYYYSNLLSSPTGTESNRPMNDNDLQGVKISMYYAPTVMLYDGVNETSLPVVLNFQRSQAVTSRHAFYIFACYPSAVTMNGAAWENDIAQTHEAITPSTIFTMGGAQNVGYSHANWKAWHPASDKGVNFAEVESATGDLFYPMGTSNKLVFTDSEKLKLRSSLASSSYWGTAINKIVYNSDPDMTSTSKEYQPSWTTIRAYDTTLHLQVHHGTANNCKLTVIDYSKIRAALGDFGKTIANYDLTKYKEGGLAGLFEAMDAISAVKPMDYFSGTANTDGFVSTINSLTSNQLPKLTAAYTTDSEAYQQLRDTFDGDNGIVSTYTKGNADGTYTENSWMLFENKYKKAQLVMANVVANGYTGDPATAKTELIDAKVALETVAVKVDTTELEAIIDEILAIAQPTILTEETVNAAKQAVETAKTAIWKSPENYKDAASKDDDSDATRAAVAEQLALLQQAMKDLRFSTSCVVSTDIGSSSLQELFDEYPSLKADEKDYVGFPEYETAYNECMTYAESLPTTEMTDYYSQYDEYIAMVTYLLEARQNLHITFLKAPDGTYIQNSSLSAMTKNTFEGKGQDNLYYAGSIRYPENAVLFKTSHEAKDLKYGEAVLTWEARQYTHYQLLDSITFHDDTVLPEGYTQNDFYNEFHSKTWVVAGYGESAIPADKRDRYSDGDLTGEGAEMTNVKVISRLQVPLGTSYAQVGDGKNINQVNEPDDPRLTEIIAKTEANVEDEKCAGLVTMSTGKDDQGIVTFTGDMIAHTPATPKYTTFEEMPVPSTDTSTRRADSYGIYGNVGFLYKWKTYGALNAIIMGYSYLTMGAISSSCYVVDISYLIDLIDMVSDTPAAPYTEESYQAFRDALEEAKSDYRYEDVVAGAADTSIGANQVAWTLSGRYNNLYNAYAALEYKQFDASFNYKDANGMDQTSVIKVTYNDKLSNYQEQIADILTPSYTKDGYKYTFKGWVPEVDLNATVTGNITYTADYTETELPADWTDYNAAKSELLSSLATRTYTAADLQKVQSTINMARFFDNKTHTPDIMSSSQSIIDAEAATFRSVIPTAVNIDASTANAIEEAKATTDKDQYDLSILDSFKVYQEVTVNGTVYEGFLYTTQAELDKAVVDTINALNANAMQYDVYLNGTKVNTDKVPFGTPVIVNGDGSFELNAADLDKDADSDYLAWYYSHSAPSTNSTQTAEKYMTTSPSLGFIVKGDTYLTTKPVTESEQGYAVRFVRGTDNKVFDVVYTDANGNFTVPNAPKLAYYSFSGYSVDGVTAGSTFQVSADTTIVANYAPQTEDKYTVNVMSYTYSIDPDDPDSMYSTEQYGYNEKVSISATDMMDNGFIDDDIYVWCEMISFDPDAFAGTFVPVYYGSDYSFYACKDVNLVAFSQTKFEEIVEDVDHWTYFDEILTVGTSGELYGVTVEDKFVKVLDEDGNLNKVSMIGTFVLPEGYKMVETGMLLGPEGSALQLENTGVDGIKRAKSTKFTPGNQFVLSLKVNDTNIGNTYDYAAYAVVEMPDGTRTTFYSQTQTDTVIK